MRRRRALLWTVAVLSPGCVEAVQDRPRSRSSESTPTPTPSPDDPGLESKGPVRGEDPATPSVEVTDTDADVEYLPENDSVRFVAARSGDSAARYRTVDFEDWAEMQCASAARDPAMEHAREELGEPLGGSVGDGEVYVGPTVVVDRDGRTPSRPGFEFDELVAATPRTVEVTYELAGRERTCEVPVYARQVVVWTD